MAPRAAPSRKHVAIWDNHAECPPHPGRPVAWLPTALMNTHLRVDRHCTHLLPTARSHTGASVPRRTAHYLAVQALFG
jgi:hypothetical protein